MWTSRMLSLLLLVILSDIIFCRTIKRDTNEESSIPNEDFHCSSRLGIARDSINIQVGFTVSSRDDSAPVTGGIGPREHNVEGQAAESREHTVGQAAESIEHNEGQAAGSTDTLQDRSYIQVEFERPMMVSGIITQGNPNSISRVTHYRVLYSEDCIEFSPVTDNEGNGVEFVGNLYLNSTNTVVFDDAVIARCVRVVPTRRVGDDTSIRFELLGCERSACRRELSTFLLDEQDTWKKFMFDKEKIVSSVKISITEDDQMGIPAFILAASRNCNFGPNDRLEYNGKTKIFTIESGSELVIDDDSFPIRAQCLAVFSPDPDRILLPDVHIRDVDVNQLTRLTPDQFHVTFYGCDALDTHDALDSCGKTRVAARHNGRRKRVVGGEASLPGEWPWLVSLHFMAPHGFTESSGLPHLCGGSLIHPQWVLSAAHCFDDMAGEGLSDKTKWVVVLGEHYQGIMDGTEQFLYIEKLIKHPNFVLSMDHAILNDIVLLKLNAPVVLSDYVNTICLEPNHTVPDGTPCLTTGWGLVDVEGVGVELPYSAELRIIPRSECRNIYDSLPDDHEAKQFVSVQDSVTCARADRNGVDSCRGDSGGPLICYHDDHWMQTGIVSIGYHCGDLRYPGLYTNVNHFYEWIESTIQEDFWNTTMSSGYENHQTT